MALVGCGNCSSKVSSIVGDWSAVLDVGIAKVTLVLHIQQNPDGTLSATFDSLEQKVNGTLIDLVAFEEGSLRFEIKAALAKFEGLLIKNASEISGQWTQAGQSFPLAFERGIKSVKAPNRPQEPKLPLPYTEEPISYDNLGAGVTLSGTLTLPPSKGPFPVVLLIAGSGPIDRDETVFGHKPFLVLADYLTRQGIAVLRFDKRGCGKSTGNYDKATSQDFADDVLAGIAYIKSRKEVNSNQIGLIGHSEGGIIAPMVAAKSKDVAFVVLMAGTGVNGEEILYEQSALIQRAVGETEDTIHQSRKFQELMFTLVKREPDPQIAAKQLQEIAKNYIAALPETQEKVTLEYLERLAARVNTKWFRYYLTFDPSITLKLVRVPVLVLNGELDLQVSSKQKLPVISKALEESGNKDFTIIELPKLNHFFQTCETGSIAEYAKIEETISPSVLNLITKWVLERTVQDKEYIDD
jgi:pimeloyl-ACP methyl ester carboxylesterase